MLNRDENVLKYALFCLCKIDIFCGEIQHNPCFSWDSLTCFSVDRCIYAVPAGTRGKFCMIDVMNSRIYTS